MSAVTALLTGTDVRALARRIDLFGGRRAMVHARLATLLTTLGVPAGDDPGTTTLLAAMEAELAGGPPDRVWLALAVLTARLPDEATVLRTVRRVRLDGPLDAYAATLGGLRAGLPGTGRCAVEVVSDEVLVDLHHTAVTGLATGIQRVARSTGEIWHQRHAPTFVGWAPGLVALRRLTDPERDRALHGPAGQSDPERAAAAVAGPAHGSVIVPWRCRYVLPELMTEPERATRLLAMLRFSGTAGSMIGFDCTPVSSGETVAAGMAAGFTAMLSAMAWGDRVAAISGGAAAEYSGWQAALGGAGLSGPRIAAVPLATEATRADPADEVEARTLLGAQALPLVLCVGSHEPRKNHLAVLHAADVLWRENQDFALAFVGGNSWMSEEFTARLDELAAAGRPVRSALALPEHLLAAAYSAARCTVFPSWNEGFGLPVAESLAAGTPVLTSRFGSTAEIARSGGALLVDPGHDGEITDALRSLVRDDALHARLSAAAREFPVRSWEQYATETWEFLVTAPSMPITAGPR